MDLEFQTVPYDRTTFLEAVLPAIPKGTAVYKIFDTRGSLIVLDKTSNLAQRLERFFGPHSERVRDLDLRQLTSRLEYVRTFSPFETTYVLYLARRFHFPRKYRRMKTFRYFTLMKINRRQRFPRIYASRQIKSGVDYFGPLVTRGQFAKIKTALERTFKLRPCPFNIRGNDPRPDCMYFQMQTCSKPCNNDIDRTDYLADVSDAIQFIQGNDDAILQAWTSRMTTLATKTRFEEAEIVRKKIEKLRRSRHEVKDTLWSVREFHYVVVMPSERSTAVRIALVRSGAIVDFQDHPVKDVRVTLEACLTDCFEKPAPATNCDTQYDEFCLVCNFIVKPLQSVQLIPFTDVEKTLQAVEKFVSSNRKRLHEETNH
jgi:excinuclease ABC subunit C